MGVHEIDGCHCHHNCLVVVVAKWVMVVVASVSWRSRWCWKKGGWWGGGESLSVSCWRFETCVLVVKGFGCELRLRWLAFLK